MIQALVNDKSQKIYKSGGKIFHNLKELTKSLEHASLKTLAAFLNTEGGQLIIGVSELDKDNPIVGIEHDFDENSKINTNDSYVLHLSGLIENQIGKAKLAKFIKISVKKMEEKKHICILECTEIPNILKPVHLDNEIYIRTSNKNEKLEGKDLVEYMRILNNN